MWRRSSKITAALNKVPGRVLVVGHTDDQPIKSLVYRDNNELSHERAVSVANILLRGHRQRSEIDVARAPGHRNLVSPGTDPESRARNRRVEIIHLHDQ